MRVVQVNRPNGPFEIVEREIPEPGAGSVRIKIKACGICHSDSLTKEGTWPGLQYPRVPGHEIAGVIDAAGAGVAGWTKGQHVGVGWHGGHCGYCDSCRRGDFVTCQIAPQVPGIAYDGGYAEYMIAPAGALALIPEGLSAVDAGPLMCAGVTTFNSLRNSGARRRRSRPLGNSVCREDGFQDRCHCPRDGQGTAGPKAWRVVLH
jgi:D-arabinose 1-dehydrogenase-like Zn-dependent alcohol dehydrogenase